MKILFLLSRLEKSGVALHTLDLAQGLVNEGHELSMITGGITDGTNAYLLKICDRFKDMGVEIKTFKTPTGNILNKAFIAFTSIFRILRWIKNSKADVVHSQSPYMTFLPWLLRKKFITTVHNVQLVKNIKYKNPTQLIAISRESRDYAIDILGARPESVSVVCHGVSKRYAENISLEDKKFLRKQHGIDEDAIVIGYVGRITVDKGLDVLIDAVEKHLPLPHKNNIHLVFLGDYFQQGDEKWLTDIIGNSTIGEKISIVPFQDPLPFYNIFNIFVLPSKSEAFGLVCVEAMMTGCCTVRTDTNGALDQITHGEDGFIFPNGDSKALAQILEHIIQSPQNIAVIAQKGREKVLANFTIDAMTEKTLNVYKKVL